MRKERKIKTPEMLPLSYYAYTAKSKCKVARKLDAEDVYYAGGYTCFQLLTGCMSLYLSLCYTGHVHTDSTHIRIIYINYMRWILYHAEKQMF